MLWVNKRIGVREELMKLQTKYIFPILIILTLIVTGCSASQLPQSRIDDSNSHVAVLKNDDSLLADMSHDAKKYLAVLCADNNIELNIKEDTYIGWYYDYWNILNISFRVKNCSAHERLLIMRNVAYYIQDWINDNYSTEETPLYEITCWENYLQTSLPYNGYISFSNFYSFNFRNIEDAKPSRSIEYVKLQVNYTKSEYEGIFFEGITHLRTATQAERFLEDYRVLEHFPDLKNVEIPMLIPPPKTQDDVDKFVENIKQYCPCDCIIEVNKDS